MQLYLSGQHDSAYLLQLINEALSQQDLQDCFTLTLKTLTNTRAETQRDLSQLLDPAVATVVLGAGGAGTVAIAKLARVIETLINSRKVEVKIKHKNSLIELSGPAGKIAKMLEQTLN